MPCRAVQEDWTETKRKINLFAFVPGTCSAIMHMQGWC